MRILTVRQPWAWAIIHGGKDVENRTRNIAGSYRGSVAIHVGLAYAHGWQSDALAREMNRSGAAHEEPQPWRANAGHIIGVVDLVDVVTDSTSEWAEVGAHHLVLANPRAVVGEPVPWLGALGLRKSDLFVTEAGDWLGLHIDPGHRPCTPYGCPPSCYSEPIAQLEAVSR